MNMRPKETGRMWQSIEYSFVNIDVAAPASFVEIFLYLISAGRKGRVYKSKKERFIEWRPSHVNCRCKTVDIGETT